MRTATPGNAWNMRQRCFSTHSATQWRTFTESFNPTGCRPYGRKIACREFNCIKSPNFRPLSLRKTRKLRANAPTTGVIFRTTICVQFALGPGATRAVTQAFIILRALLIQLTRHQLTRATTSIHTELARITVAIARTAIPNCER